ncbi:hypothetical protein C7379_101190 [Hallella colorans]|uniref:Uncharacterized protein n=1 Tax=Hallella colorans TaxID=1703337 RepID=A0A2U0UP65_9BACT|nr:hypothetical protein C7379_101190 [Hallella colorans]
MRVFKRFQVENFGARTRNVRNVKTINVGVELSITSFG